MDVQEYEKWQLRFAGAQKTCADAQLLLDGVEQRIAQRFSRPGEPVRRPSEDELKHLREMRRKALGELQVAQNECEDVWEAFPE